jgi:hemolysin activation/secretion protein
MAILSISLMRVLGKSWLLTWSCASLLALGTARAAPGGLPPPDRPGDDRLRLPDYARDLGKPREAAPTLVLPPLPDDSGDRRLSRRAAIRIEKIVLIGATVFPEEDLRALVRPYEHRLVSAEELHRLRQELTAYYIDRGYINSGALIPDQAVKNGRVELRIVEGRLSDIKLSGLESLKESYLLDRLAFIRDEPLNVHRLRDKILLLRDNPPIRQIQAELTPGKALGESALNIQVKENRPYHLDFTFNNYRSPSVAAYLAKFWLSHDNLSGRGDRLSAGYGNAEGLDEYEASYALPLNALDTALKLYFSHNDSSVIQEPFRRVGVTSETETYGIGLNQPFYRTPSETLSGGLSFERRHSKTYLLGQPFSFTQGPRNGASDISALRLLVEWLERDPSHALALRSTLSVGLDALNATANPSRLPDGRFVAWLGQFQWVQRLWDTDNLLVVRSDAQLTPDRLLPLEQFAVGGHASVRGYRENQLVRDNGWASSLEFRIPVLRLPVPYLSANERDGQLFLAPFYDFGWSWNSAGGTPSPKTISSVGLGLRWSPGARVSSELYWGYPLRKLDNGKARDLQDSGVHFAFNLNL